MDRPYGLLAASATAMGSRGDSAAGAASDILVKRIVGLPGESVEIRGGDVYVDGQIQRKNLAEQHALAVPVYDASFPPTLEPTPPPRWRPEHHESGWSLVGGRFTHPAGPGSGPIDWLVYHHCRRVMSTTSGKSPVQPNAPLLHRGGLEPSSTVSDLPVTDVCGYNQSQPRREENSHAVADLLLCFRLEPVGNGTFYVRATDGGEAFETRFRPRRERASTVALSSVSRWRTDSRRQRRYEALGPAAGRGVVG